MPIHSGKGFFTEFTAHWLWDTFADFIAPVSFVLLSYMDEMALNATRKNRARKEATLKELKVYARMFIEAEVCRDQVLGSTTTSSTLSTSGSSNRRTLSQAGGCLPLSGIEMASSRSAKLDGCFEVFKTIKRMLSRRTALLPQDQVCDFFARMLLPMGGRSATLTSRLRSFRGKVMHQIAMWSVSFLQKQVNRGI